MVIEINFAGRFALCALAVWRIAHLLAKENGPWNLIARLRATLGSGVLGCLMDCFYSLSFLISLPVAVWMSGSRFLDFTAPGLVRAGISVICPCTLLQNTAVGADITIDKPHANSELVVISITGEIRPGDNIVFAGLAMGAKQIWLNLNSPGGDVAAAIGIGSEDRRRDAIAHAF